MRILMVTRKYPPSVGGMQRYAADLHDALAARHDVTLIKWGGGNTWLPVVLPILALRALIAVLRGAFDVIHVQDSLLAPLGVVLGLVSRRPVTVIGHGLDLTFDGMGYQRIVPSSLRRLDRVICISSAAAHEAIIRGVDPGRVVVIPVGVTDDLISGDRQTTRREVAQRLGLREERCWLLSVGRLVPRKGLAWYVSEVLPVIAAERPGVELLVGGDGPEADRILENAEAAGQEGRVHLLGRIDDDLLRSLYNSCDVFVMPNRRVHNDMEGFGRVLVEAAVCRLPVVAVGIEGILDAIADGRNGVLVDHDDADGFATAVLGVLDGRVGPDGDSARQYTLAHFGWDVVAQQFTDVFTELTGERP